MHPLVRWQFRGGIAEKDRKAFLFTNVIDSKGRKYDIPVLIGGLAANRGIYRIGIGCPFEEIDERWVRATQNPISPRIVEDAPCHEIVISGKALDKPGQGLDGIPFPISTPGWDIAPYATLSQYITKDPDSGVQNMGNYRGQVKARRRLGMNPSLELRPGIYNHWEKLRARGFKKLPTAVVLGAPPCVTFASVQKVPERLDELARRRRAGRLADQCRESQDGGSAGAGGGRDRHRGVHRYRISRARGAVRRIARPRQSAGVQRLYGRHLHHAAARCRADLHHLPGDAVGIEPDQAHRDGAAVPQPSAEHARHQMRQARLDARAADQHPQGHTAGDGARCAGDRDLAGALRRRRPAPGGREIRHRASTTTSIPTMRTPSSGPCPIEPIRASISTSCRTATRAMGRAASATAGRTPRC